MFKKIVTLLTVIFVIAACLFAVSCDGSDADGNQGGDATNQVKESKFRLFVENEELYTMVSYPLYIDFEEGHEAFNYDISALKFELSENTAEAVFADGAVKASKEGSVKISVSYSSEQYKAAGSVVLTFKAPKVSLKEYDSVLYVGDNVELGYGISQQYSDYEGTTYTVLEGNAKIFADDSGRQYIRASSAGDVKISIVCKAAGTEFTGTDTLTFNNHNFIISSPNAVEYVGYSVQMSAICETMSNFDPQSVVYSVTDPDATVEGNIVTYTKEGVITVEATYVHNEETIKTSVDITFTYDENTIFTADDLSKLRNSDKVFNLLADIDLSGYSSWLPISDFTGILYGNGYSITGFSLSPTELGKPAGFFDELKGTVNDLTISGNITCYGEIANIGILCGINSGTINNVTASGTINAKYSDYVGGIVGFSNNSNITACTSNVSIEARDYVGGIAGFMRANRTDGAILMGYTNNGEVSGRSHVGGIVGSMRMRQEAGNATVILSKFTNNASVNGTGDDIGGIFGYLTGHLHDDWNDTIAYYKVTECTNTGEVSGNNNVGGIVGSTGNYVNEINLCTNTANVSGAMYVGGFVGKGGSTKLSDLVNSVKVTGKAYVGGIAGSAGVVSGCTNNGKLSIIDYYIDDNNTPLSYVGGVVGYADNVVNCENNVDIDVSYGGYYVGGIVGYLSASRSATTINGNVNNGEIKGTIYVGGIAGIMRPKDEKINSTITVNDNENNGVINGSGNYVGGLFGYLSGKYSRLDWNDYYSYVKVVSCVNEAAVSGNDYVGGIIGYSPEYVSEISLCKNNDTVTGNLYVGGIVGKASGVTMKNMTNSQTITGKAYLGGIAGWAGKLEGCTNNGDIVNVDYYVDDDLNALSYIGGIAGYATGIVNCTNEKGIDASDGGAYVGGVVGYIAKTRSASDKVDGNKNHGEIKGTSYVGGIAGYVKVDDGKNNDTIIVSDNINDGIISGTGNYVGGIFGRLLGDYARLDYNDYYSYVKITGCKNEAAVSGVDYVGGIVGSASEYVSEISLCTNVDDITGNIYVGGYAGYAYSTAMTGLKNSYTITGKAYVGGIAGRAGKLTKCENNGTLVITGYILSEEDSSALSYVGGIAGYADGAVNCVNNANIDVSMGGKYVGGIAGFVWKTRSASDKFTGNQNHGEIKGTSYVGGLAGYMAVLSDVKINDSISVDSNTNDGNIIATGNYVGGLFGYLNGKYSRLDYNDYYSYVKVTSCSSDADITGNDYVGGFVGGCGKYVESADTAWNTNSFTGDITATGENQGNNYGYIEQ